MPCLSDGQKENLKKYLATIRSFLSDRRYNGQFAVCHIDRNPDKSGMSSIVRTDGLAPCLRAPHHSVFIISLGKPKPDLCRMLHPAEACLLQGMRPSIVPPKMTRAKIFEGVGNAMREPVVGAVLAQVLRICAPRLMNTDAGSDSGSESTAGSESSSSSTSSE